MNNLGNWLRVTWDRVAAVALIAAGAVALLLGWIGMSDKAFPALQLPYLISGGITGLFVLGLGALCWMSADLRDEWTKLDRIEEALNRLADTSLVDRDALSSDGNTVNVDLVETSS